MILNNGFSKTQIETLFRMQLSLNQTLITLIKTNQESLKKLEAKMDGAIEDMFDNDLPKKLSGLNNEPFNFDR